MIAAPSYENSRRVTIAIAVAVAVLLPMVFVGVPNGADLANHLRFAQPFYESIQSGRWHPGWLAESNDGFGDPRFRFYPPGLYYVLIAGRALFGNWYVASIASMIFFSALGSLGVYLWTRSICSAPTAMWAAILYSITPYRLNEVYQASLLSEYAACAILPFAFAFTERIIKERKLIDVCGLAASFALLILTHLPLTLIGSMSLAAYVLLRIERKTFWRSLGHLALGVGVGLAASAFFWTTMLVELSWIKGSQTDPNPYYDYRLNFLFSPAALTNRNTWYANILACAIIGFTLPAIVIVGRLLRDRVINRPLFAVAIVVCGSLLFATPLSRPLWIVIPKLSEVQFPWRWLSITSLAGSILMAASIAKWKEIIRTRIRPREIALGFAFVLSLFFIVTQIIVDCDYLNRGRFETLAHDVRGGPSFKDWLPLGARDLLHLEVKMNNVDAGSRTVTVQSWNAEQRSFQVAAGPEKEARVRTYYYPLWQATAHGRVLATRAAEDGSIIIALPAAAATVELEFKEPPRVRYAEAISLFGWLSIAALSGLSMLRKNSLSRYALAPATSR